MARLTQRAQALRERWDRWMLYTFQSGARADLTSLAPDERRWLAEQLFGLPDDSNLLPAVVWALSRPDLSRDDAPPREPGVEFALDALLDRADAHRHARALQLLAETVCAPGDRIDAVYGALLAAVDDEATRDDALLAIGGRREQPPGVEAYLRERFLGFRGSARAAALRGLHRLRFDPVWEPAEGNGVTETEQELLTIALADPDPEPAIAALAIVGESGQLRVWEAAITDCLLRDDRAVKLAAIDVAERIEGPRLSTARALAMIVTDDAPDVAHQALWALAATGHGHRLTTAQLARCRGEDGLLTCPALICLRHHGFPGAALVDDVIDAVKRADVFDQKHALITLHAIAPGHEPAFDALVAASRRGHYDVARAAAVALAPFGERGVPHIAALLALPIHAADVATALDAACPDPGASAAVWTALAVSSGAARTALIAWLRARVPDDARLPAD